MNRTRKIKITELNPHVICVLCGGYYINATTITECLHSFCRTCITRYLETSKYCPVCDVMVHKTRPLEYIRSDKTLQDLVYKLVPGLYKMEMKRRREYYFTHDSSNVPHQPSEDRGDEFYDRIIYTEDEKISLSLELCAEGIPFKTPSTIHGHSGPENIKIKDVRYLQCPAAFSVGNIKKFIRMKFDLKQKYEIDVFHTAEPLLDYYTLMDIAYIYTWTRRAPLRLYYTVYVNMERPRVPETITRPHPVTVADSHVIDTQQVNCEHSVEPDKENQETKSAKRKFPDGPGDISPDLELEKKRPLFNESKRKDSSAPRKRAKKQVVYDSSVLEAMSESEEQLAKLTLGGDDEGAIADKEKKRTVDSEEGGASVNKTGETNSDSLTDKTVNKDEAGNGDSAGKDSNVLESINHITLSQFQPLNVSTKDKNVTNGCVYEFSNENTDKGEASKPKGKPGKKKKVTDGGKKVSSKLQGNTSSKINTANVSKNLGHNQQGIVSPMKKNQNIDQDQKGNKIAKKRGRPPGKKVIKTDSEEKVTEVRVKRKYVRKNVKKDGENVESLDKASSNGVQSDTKQSRVNESCENVDKTCVNGNNKSETCVNSGAVNKLGNAEPGHIHANTNTDKVVDGASEAKSVTEAGDINTEMVTNSAETVHEPTTPLYGQTPKGMEETQGLPVSPNPDCADSGSINNGANCDIGDDGKNGDMKNVNKTSDVTKCAYRPVGHSEPAGSGYNSGGVTHHGVPVIVSSVSPSHMTPSAFTGFNSCDTVSGNSNGYTRNGVQANMASFNENLSPLSPMSPPGVCVMAGYQRLTDPHTGHPVTNGYSVMDQNSDQPLDLTNNGHREEYTKGKIFKTKLLKKNYAKADTVPNTKDKTNSQTANGLISAPWV